MMELTSRDLIEAIRVVSEAMSAARNDLNALDSALGDGDHGTSLSAAFADAAAKVAALPAPSPHEVLKATAQSLMNRMGGASGALYGTLFLRGSMAAQDRSMLSHDDMKRVWQSALEGVMKRGKAQPGDKTMVDALKPAVEAFAAGQDFRESFELAASSAAAGAAQTADMVARHGRARFVGERAIGHVDAGAASIAVMFDAFNAYWKERPDGKT
jgi:phosphoenolpyruvate---glycerone phosphotransferase subunit DhaL